MKENKILPYITVTKLSKLNNINITPVYVGGKLRRDFFCLTAISSKGKPVSYQIRLQGTSIQPQGFCHRIIDNSNLIVGNLTGGVEYIYQITLQENRKDKDYEYGYEPDEYILAPYLQNGKEISTDAVDFEKLLKDSAYLPPDNPTKENIRRYIVGMTDFPPLAKHFRLSSAEIWADSFPE
ncbi:MAG: hypothetical protein RLZZ210_1663 [Pseudomonadota bacterium]|jgi:hypothetical protein